MINIITMSVYHRSTAKSRILQEFRDREEEIAAALSSQINHKNGVENEKRMRRAIANSNERRRMQSINAGFQVLRSLLPQSEGEKLSKAAILQQTTEFINSLQQDKAKLSAQNAAYKRLLGEISRQCNIDLDLDLSLYGGSPPLKRKKRDTESSDEGIMADYEDCRNAERMREVIELRKKLEQERQLRMILELRANNYETRHLEKAKTVEIVAETKVQPLTQSSHAVQSTEQVKQKAADEPVWQINQKAANEPVWQVNQKAADEPVWQVNQKAADEPVALLAAAPVDVDLDHRVQCSPQHKSESIDQSHAVFRQNLYTIVEAIRHVEGKEEPRPLPSPCSHMLSVDLSQPRCYVPHSEESEDVCGTSDQDEMRSDRSGRETPPSNHNLVRLHSASSLLVQSVSSSNISPSLSSSSVYSSNSENYTAMRNILKGNSPHLHPCYRPGVIVQKL